ncbi:MAG: hypothetical protein HYZ73_01495 [Elusimicrobia bacterium]|nr:hypothetical protein [Elusimicrobiota bacterium]
MTSWRGLSLVGACLCVLLVPGSLIAEEASRNTRTVSTIFAFPVPFQPARDPRHRTITFANVPRNSTIQIFTVAGDLVRKLGSVDPATDQIVWDVTDNAGMPVASDVYLYVAEEGGRRKTGKLIILR